ncbi:urease accessory protein UreD [Paracoccus kondratievae]
MVVTTQTAERAYRSVTGRARVSAHYTVADRAHLDLLPQETILFDGAALVREQEVTLTGSATCLWAEVLILGRAAMGETVTRLDLSDRRRISRDGRPVFVENLRLTDRALAATGPAMLGAAAPLPRWFWSPPMPLTGWNARAWQWVQRAPPAPLTANLWHG